MPSSFFGQVLGLDGKPAANVQVRGFLISNNGGGLVSNNGSGLLSDKGTSYRLLADDTLSTTTDDQGHFKLVDPQGRPINLEAVQSDTQKAIQFNVGATASNLTLQLAHTGSISGKVTASKAPAVTNFTGVDVFVPGTSYTAKTAADGSFVISNVPVGTFALYGAKTGLGTATAADIKVESDKTAAATLDLSVTQPVIASITPANAGPGAEVTITGDHFGASDGSTFTVGFGGALATTPNRVDDKTIKVTVPSGASSGDVVVNVGGITSNAKPLTVIKSLQIAAPGKDLPLSAKEPLSVLARDADGKDIPNPMVTWYSDGKPLTIGADGLVTAVSAGSVTITASTGTVAATVKMYAYAGSPVVTTLADDTDTAIVSDVFSMVSSCGGLACDANGNLLVADDTDNLIDKFTPAGVGSVFFQPPADASDSGYHGLAIDAAGNAYVSDQTGNRILKVTPAGQKSVFAGPADSQIDPVNGGPSGTADGQGNTARFNQPSDLAIDAAGNLYVADMASNAIRKITPSGNVSTLVPGSAGLNAPEGLGIDAAGNLYVADTGSSQLYKVTAAGQLSVVTTSQGVDALPIVDAAVDSHGTLYAICGPAAATQDVLTAAKVYKVVGSTLTPLVGGPVGYVDGDATGARFGALHRIVVTADDNLVVADQGDPNSGNGGSLRKIYLHP